MDDIFTGYNWSGLTILRAEHLITTPEKCVVYHDRTNTFCYQLGAKFCGETKVSYNGRNYDYSAGTILYLPKEKTSDISYVRSVLKPGEGVCIFFDSINELPSRPTIIPCANRPQVRELFMKLAHSYKQQDEFLCMSYFFRLLSKVRDEAINHPDYKSLQKRLQPSIDYIKDHFCDEYIDISALADICGMTSEYFRHQFKRAFHISPLKYINHQKAEHAKILLLNENTVSFTAAALGFSDLNYFSRFFKEYTGMSPSHYRTLYRDIY